jgi:hypothetical protein
MKAFRPYLPGFSFSNSSNGFTHRSPAGLLQPYQADSKLKVNKQTQLDRLYQKVLDDLEELVGAVGLKAA